MRVARCREHLVRVVGADGGPVVGVPVEFGVFGENGMASFTPMLGHATDARGEAHLRIPEGMGAMLSRNGALAVQVALVGAEPVRRALADVAAGGAITLAMPPHGKVIVRLYDEREQPLAALAAADLRRAGQETRRDRPSPAPIPSAAKAQRLEGGAAHFDFVALGQELVATVQGDGIAGLAAAHPDRADARRGTRRVRRAGEGWRAGNGAARARSSRCGGGRRRVRRALRDRR